MLSEIQAAEEAFRRLYNYLFSFVQVRYLLERIFHNETVTLHLFFPGIIFSACSEFSERFDIVGR